MTKAHEIGPEIGGYKVYSGRDGVLNNTSEESEYLTFLNNFAPSIFELMSAYADMNLALAGLMGSLTGAILGSSSRNAKRFAKKLEMLVDRLNDAMGGFPDHRGDFEKDSYVFANEPDLETVVNRQIEEKMERDKESARAAGGIGQGA